MVKLLDIADNPVIGYTNMILGSVVYFINLFLNILYLISSFLN